MKNVLYSAVFITALFLTGCADAGSDQEVAANQSVTLNASGSTASAGGTITSYKWEQTQGPDVVLANQDSVQSTFTAPSVEKLTNVVFKLTVVETGGKISPYETKDYVVVVVRPNNDNNVTDTTKPVITLHGESNVSVELGGTYTELGAEATDNVDGNLTNSIAITGTVDTGVAGVYFVKYNVSDAAGNVADEVTRVVNVIDNNGTTITVESISDGIEHEGSYIRHHIILSDVPNESVAFHISFQNISTSDDDYNSVPSFDIVPGGSLVLNNDATVLTVTGFKEFDLFMYITPDELVEDAETYKIFLGDKSAIGTIVEGS